MFLKANISARTAEASEWWSMQIQNKLIKTEHAQNSLWYLNSCLWNPVQELHRVTIYIIIPQVTVFHNTSHAQISGGALSTETVSPSCLLLALLFITLSPCLANKLFDVNRAAPKYWLSVSYTAAFMRKWKLLQDIMDNPWFAASCLEPVVWTSLCHLGESASNAGLGQRGLAVLEVIVSALC